MTSVGALLEKQGVPSPHRSTLGTSSRAALFRGIVLAECPASCNAAARLWINGVEVRHGRRVLLRRGGYHVAMRTTFGGGHEPVVRPRFWLSNDVNNEREQAEAELRRVRPYLERAARLLPDTKVGKRAARRIELPSGSGGIP